MADMRDSIRSLLEATHPERNHDPEVRSASWRRLSLLPGEDRERHAGRTMEEMVREVLHREMHPLALTAIRDYLTMAATDVRERETARDVLRQRLRQRPLPPPIQKVLLDTLLPVSRTLPDTTHRETVMSLIHTPSIIHPELCVRLGEELLSFADIHPGRGQYRTNDRRIASALKDLSGKLGEHHRWYPYFRSQSIHLSRPVAHLPKKMTSSGHDEMVPSLDLERYLLSRRPHFRGHLLQSLFAPPLVQKKEVIENRHLGDRSSPETFLEELVRELRGTRHESVRAAGYELLAEADQYRPAPCFPAILSELIRSGPRDWKGFRLTLEEYITQTPWYDPEGWEQTGKTLWKFMHQNGETETYTPLVQALTTRLTPIRLTRVVTSYPAASPMPEPMVRSLRRHLASNLITRAAMMTGEIGADWKVMAPGQTVHPAPPALQRTYEQWKKRFMAGNIPDPAEIDRFVESCGRNHQPAARFFTERLSAEQEPLDGLRAWNWRVAGAIIRRWKPEAIGELARLAVNESGAEPDPLVLATRLAQGRACRHAMQTLSPDTGERWCILYAGELVEQWYQSSPPTRENRELRWIKFHEMHLLRKVLRETGSAGATEWGHRLQTVMEETFHGNDWQESLLAATCFRQNGETPRQAPNVPQPERRGELADRTPTGLTATREHGGGSLQSGHMENRASVPCDIKEQGREFSQGDFSPHDAGQGVNPPPAGGPAAGPSPSGPWRRPTFFR